MADPSSAIGLFSIGESPIGGGVIPPFNFDYERTILSQYANSPTIRQLIKNMDAYINPRVNIYNFYSLVWNVDTAVGYGLDVWGRIVGVGRVLEIATVDFFGFTGPFGVSGEPFNQAPFYHGQTLTANYALLDGPYRALILAKALANITDGAIPSLNAILLRLFPNRGDAFVTDDGGMAMTYTFKFALTAVEAAIVTQSGVLPKPDGVTVTYVQAF